MQVRPSKSSLLGSPRPNHWPSVLQMASDTSPQSWRDTALWVPEDVVSCSAAISLFSPHSGPCSSSSGNSLPSPSSFLQSLWSNPTWRGSQTSSPPTMSLQTCPSGLIAWTQGNVLIKPLLMRKKDQQLLVYSKILVDLEWNQSLLRTRGGKEGQHRDLNF